MTREDLEISVMSMLCVQIEKPKCLDEVSNLLASAIHVETCS